MELGFGRFGTLRNTERERENVLPYRFFRCCIYYWAFYYELGSFPWEKDSSLFIRSQSVNGRNWEKGVGGPARDSLRVWARLHFDTCSVENLTGEYFIFY